MESDHEKKFLSAYDAYADALFRHCYFRVYDRDLAKDLVQETFSRTWVYMTKGKKVENIRAFLYRVANNLVIDEYRKKQSLSLESLIEEGFSPKDESIPDPEQRLLGKEVVQKLEFLEESHRTVITMRFMDELSLKEIAAVLGLSENVVSVRIHRGIKKLQKLAQQNLQ